MLELQVRLCGVDQLVPFPSNARTHSETQITQIAASIKEYGWTNPILIGPDNVIIAGHARLAAARKLGLTEVPVIELGHLTEAQRRSLVIADNQLALNAGWDEELLRLELHALQEQDVDLDLLGFDVAELDRLLAPVDELDRADARHQFPR
jgi:ParB-like chromosome segregation protein Spo0J